MSWFRERRKKKDMRRWHKNIDRLWNNHSGPYKDIEDEYGFLRIRKIRGGFLLYRGTSLGELYGCTRTVFVEGKEDNT